MVRIASNVEFGTNPRWFRIVAAVQLGTHICISPHVNKKQELFQGNVEIQLGYRKKFGVICPQNVFESSELHRSDGGNLQ
jgi:hypothetical protein